MPTRIPRPRASRRTLIIGIISIVVVLVLLGTSATFYTDLLWFKETGFQSVFYKQIWSKFFLGLTFGVIFAGVMLLNLWVVQKITSPSRLFTLQDQALERYRATLQPYVRLGVIGLSVLFGFFAGSGATSQWRSYLLWSHSQRFGTKDPIFHKDIGFYIFRLPFDRFVFTWAFSSLLVITLLVGLAHYFMGGIRAAPSGERVTPQVKAHLSVLLGLLVLLKAWGYRLDQFGLLDSPRGTVTGASYTDVHAQLPAFKLLVIIAIVSAVLFLINIRLRGWATPAAAIGILALTSILVGGVYPALVQRLRVTPQERTKEKPFIDRNIKATQAAFRLDAQHIAIKPFPGTQNLNAKDIAQNQGTVQNIRLWRPQILQNSYTQLQRITPYYEFFDVDVDRYKFQGAERQVMLSAREIFQSGLPTSARTWLNNHLVYTHGYDVVASRVDRVSGDGTPDFVIQDIPGVSDEGLPDITQPRVYYGELEDVPFVLVNTTEQEVDYPVGDGVKTTNYKGRGGVQMKNILRRAAFAWRFKDFNILISGAIKGDSRILFRRNIQDRLRMVAPYLQFDSDPYLAIINGRLTWIDDAYTTTDMYPYSQRVNLAGVLGPNKLRGTANYIRNSVKATVDAFNGTITLYAFDQTDPILRAWEKIFPTSFKPASAITPELAAHLRYPEDMFTVQASQYALYHISDPNDFYQREDAWKVPDDPRPDVTGQFPPYYVIMKLPDETSEQFLLMLPFTPFSQSSGGGNSTPRTNMTAWLAAKSDPNGYGQMTSFVFPRAQNIPGPQQIEARIQQDPTVSAQLSLWNRTGSQVNYGDLLVIPIEKGLIYVQPLYLSATSGALPELKRVVVVSGDVVKMGETLPQALDAVFGGGAGAPVENPGTTPPPVTGNSAVAQALAHFRAANEALRRGDLAAFQREYNAGVAILEKANNPSSSPSPKPS